MRRLWRRYAAIHDALKQRERVLVLVGAVALAVFALHALLIAPEQLRQRELAARLARQGDERVRIEGQRRLLAGAAGAADVRLRRELEELRAGLAGGNASLEALEHSLVPPARVPALLQDLLARRPGLQLLALRSLPVEPLVAAPPAGGASAEAAPQGIFRHGVEVSVRGAYAELLAYLEALEGASQRLYWARVQLRAQDYPLSTLTVTVYTLSLDRTWLTI